MRFARKFSRKNESLLLLQINGKINSERGNRYQAAGPPLKAISRSFGILCKINTVWKTFVKSRAVICADKRETKIHICRLVAWTYAAHGIAFKQ